MAFTLFQWFLMVVLLYPAGSLPKAESVLMNMDKTENVHPFFISVTEISHNKKEKTLEVICKIFADDMEETLKKNYKTAIDINDDKQQEKIQQLMAGYFNNHLQISTDNKPAALQLIGFEKEAESVFCYLEAKDITTLKKIGIHNTILHDFTPQQINIIHVIVNGKRQSIKLDYPQQTAAFAF